MANVQLIYGRTGRVMPQLVFAMEKARKEGFETIVLVPEQYTLEAERQIMSQLHLKGLLDLTVLSPTRLNRYVKERAGKAPYTVLDGHGVNMAMSLSLTYAQKSLCYYQSVCEKQGFIKKMTGLIQGLKKGGMTYEGFEEYAREFQGKNAQKLKHQDILDVWRAYEKTLEGRFLDSEDEQEDMLKRLEENRLMDGVALMVYGFDMLSEKTMRVVALAAKQARTVNVFMLMDDLNAPDGEIYAPMWHSLKRLECIVSQTGEGCVWLPVEKSSLNKAAFIGHLEENLFARKPSAFAGDLQGLTLRCALNPYQEAVGVARDMLRLNEQGMDFQDMAVLLCEPSQYESILPSLFKGYGIPFYMAKKTPASGHGLIRFVITALEAIGDQFSSQTMISHLKSGFTTLTGDECYKLENYVIANGVNRKKFLAPFTRGEDGAEMEACREQLMAPLVALRKAIMESRDAVSSMTAVFQLLLDVNAYNRLLADEKRLLDYGMQNEAARNRQVWQTLLSILEQMTELLDGRRAPGAHVAKWLAAGLYDTELSALPPCAKEVLVGELGHVMTGEPKAVFILGFQDDALIRKADSLLTDEEMARMKNASGLSLMPQTSDMNCLAKCDLVKAVSLPKEKLFISYAEATTAGEALRPNSLIDFICRQVIPDAAVAGSLLDKPYDEEPLAPLPALEAVAYHARDGGLDKKWLTALRWLMERPEYEAMTRMTASALEGEKPAANLPQDKARPLFAADNISISRLEQFGSCPYKHFIHYGLRPVENKEFVFTYQDRGIFFHEALRAYMSVAVAEEGFPHLTREHSDELLKQAVSKETEKWKEGPLYESQRNLKKAEEYIHTASHAAWLVLKHAQNGDFVTVGTEIRFGEETGMPPVILELKDGSQVALNGIVDRVDSFHDGQNEYLRIVDYKSSAQTLKPAMIMGGLQLQLIIYFEAMLGARAGSQPGGAFYFHVNEPMAELQQDDRQTAEAAIAGKGHLSGIALNDKAVLGAMVSQDEDYSAISDLITLKGEIKKGANVLSQPEWEKLLGHTKELAQGYAQEIAQGTIHRLPYVFGEETACDKCDFASVCLMDPQKDGQGFRRVRGMKLEEMTEQLHQLYPDK